MSTSEIQQQVEKNYRHNFIVNALDGTFYWFGYSLIAPAVILPLYISHFTDNPLIIGLIPTINTACFLLPQLFTSNMVQRAPRKMVFPVKIGFFTERIPVFLLAPSALLFARDNPMVALISFFLLYTWYSLGAGLIIVGWQDMIAKIIPVDRRGRFFGITNFAGNTSGILGAMAIPIVLANFDFPMGYVIAFIGAAILIFLSWASLSLVREPAVPSSRPPVSQLDYLRSLPAILRKDHNFTRYLVYSVFNALGGMAIGFLVVYSAQKWNLTDSQAGAYGITMQIGQAVTNLFFGFLADRKGHKLSLEISVLCSVASFILAVLAPDPLWFYPVFFLRGAAFAGAFISGIAIVMEFTHAEERPTYFGLANTIPGIFSAIAPMIGGWLAGGLGYPTLFVTSAVVAALGYAVLHWFVREPRSAITTGAVEPIEEKASAS